MAKDGSNCALGIFQAAQYPCKHRQLNAQTAPSAAPPALPPLPSCPFCCCCYKPTCPHTPLRQHRASWDMAPSNQLASSSAHRLRLGAAALIWRSWDWFWCSAWNVRSLKWILWMSERRNVAKCLTRDVLTHWNADVTTQKRAGFSLKSRFLFESPIRGIVESTEQANNWRLKSDRKCNPVNELTHLCINGKDLLIKLSYFFLFSSPIFSFKSKVFTLFLALD